MAISRFMRAALRAFSYPELDIKKNYKFLRQMENLTHKNYFRSLMDYKTWDHQVTCGDHDVPVRLFSPDDRPEGHPLLIFFHGGGWVMGNIDSYDRVCAVMAKETGRLVVSVDYQLAPEHPFPSALLDCYAVTREVFLDETLFTHVVQDVVLVGDSAGGNLAAAVSLMARDRGEFAPRRQILIYPATYNDHTEASPFVSVHENGTDYLLTAKRVCEYMELYQGTPEDWHNPYFAPLLAKDLSGQPDTLILTAEFDPLRDEGEAYGEKLRTAGNRVQLYRMPDALHGFISLPPRYGHVKQAYDIINRFLKEGSDPA